MKKNVLIFGLLLGAVLCISVIVMVNMMYTNPDVTGNDLWLCCDGGHILT